MVRREPGGLAARRVARDGRTRRRRARRTRSTAWCSTARRRRSTLLRPRDRDRSRRRGPRHLRRGSSGKHEREARGPGRRGRARRSRASRRRRSSSAPLGWTRDRAAARLGAAARPLGRATSTYGDVASASTSSRRRGRARLAEPRRPRRGVPELALRSTRRAATRCLRAAAGYAVVGRKRHRGVDTAVRRRPRRADVPRDALAAPRVHRAPRAARASCSRCSRARARGRVRLARASSRRPRRSTSWARRSQGELDTDRRAPGASRSATRTSSDAAARLRHAAGRPGASGARRDGAEDPRARRARRRGGRARRPRGRRRRCPTNCRVRHVPRRAARPGAACASRRALARELPPRPDRASSRTCARSTPCSRRRSRGRSACRVAALVHALEARRATLRAAARLVERRSSASTGARSRSTRRRCGAIGHGIDLDEFPCRTATGQHATLRALALGRYSPAKGLETILRARRAGPRHGLDVRLEAHGPALHAARARAPRRARALRDELGLDDARAARHGRAARRRCPSCSRRADVLVNNMEAGAPDKVVYEAAASCLPVLASNPVFDELLDGRSRCASSATTPSSSPTRLAQFAGLSAERARRDRPHAARARRGAATRSSTGPTRILEAGAVSEPNRPAPRRRSPASRAPRRTCSRSCRGCASAAGTSAS